MWHLWEISPSCGTWTVLACWVRKILSFISSNTSSPCSATTHHEQIFSGRHPSLAKCRWHVLIFIPLNMSQWSKMSPGSHAHWWLCPAEGSLTLRKTAQHWFLTWIWGAAGLPSLRNKDNTSIIQSCWNPWGSKPIHPLKTYILIAWGVCWFHEMLICN